MTPQELRRHCLNHPGATEDFPFGETVSVFKVATKIFAITDLTDAPLEVSVKCDPDLAQALRAQHRAVRAGYHLDKRHWNTVTIDGSLDDAEIEAMIDDSYDLVVGGLPRAQRQALGEHEERLA